MLRAVFARVVAGVRMIGPTPKSSRYVSMNRTIAFVGGSGIGLGVDDKLYNALLE
ncbi:hypothetical protein ACTXMG_01090 [Corynebacterium flavescens]|uniref:hypothetical protein n=1 Tax=Corynebacterium flavescens TaxID=28028 RepID=UPI003FD4C324